MCEIYYQWVNLIRSAILAQQVLSYEFRKEVQDDEVAFGIHSHHL